MKKAIIPAARILLSICLLRGQKVILDSELAHLYGVTTANLNKAVSRNRDRFPPDFLFQLTASEVAGLIFQFGISKGRAVAVIVLTPLPNRGLLCSRAF